VLATQQMLHGGPSTLSLQPAPRPHRWHDKDVGDVVDWHVYVGPEAPPPVAHRAGVLGEFGGLGLLTPGHMWNSSTAFSYELEPSAAVFQVRRADFLEKFINSLGFKG
jgi:hypothetical protein